MKNLKNENAITLIALVITIIVLLILAGVSMAMLTGDNGTLIRANEAKEKMEVAQKDEQTDLEIQNSYIESTLNGIMDGVIIPKGFYYVGGSQAEGIVISDNPADAGKGTNHESAQTLIGNQFVWIPVDKNTFETKFKRTKVNDGNERYYCAG